MKFNERKIGIWLAVALALFYIVFSIGVIGASDTDDEGSQIPFVVGGVLSGIFILAGLRYERSNLRVGGIITIVGALTLGLLLFWLVVPVIIAITVAALTVRRTFISRAAEGDAGVLSN